MLEDVQENLDQQIKEAMAAIDAKKADKESEKSDDKSLETKDTQSDKSEPKDEWEEKALKMGWNPKGSKDAKRFVEDKSFFDKIDSKNKKIDELTGIVKSLVDHNTKVEKASYEKALRDLQTAKDEAINTADMNRYKAIEREQVQIHKQIQEVDKHAETLQVKEEVQADVISPELLKFKEDNKDWFNLDTDENKDMVEDADYIDKRIGKSLHREGRKVSQAEHLQMVVDAIKKQYPHRFKNEKRSGVASVEGSSTSSRDVGNKLSSKLTKQQRDFVKQARVYGSKMTEESYAKQLKLTGELRDE